MRSGRPIRAGTAPSSSAAVTGTGLEASRVPSPRWYGRRVSVWRTPTPSELVRSRPLRLLARPFRERHFTFDAYASFVDRLGTSEMRVVPLRELRTAPRDRPVLGLRHDVDE